MKIVTNTEHHESGQAETCSGRHFFLVLIISSFILLFYVNNTHAQIIEDFKIPSQKIKNFPKNTVFTAFINDRGVLWYSDEMGLHCYDGNVVKNYVDKSGDLIDYFINMYEYSIDTIFVYSHMNLWTFTKGEFEKLNFNLRVNKFLRSKAGILYLATSEGLYQYANSKFSLISAVAKNNISDLVENKSGQIYFYADSSINMLDKNKSTLLIKTSSSGGKLAIDKNDILYYTDTCINIYKNGSRRRIYSNEDNLTTFYTTKEKTVFFNSSNIIHKIIRDSIVIDYAVIKDDHVKSFLFDKNNELWIFGTGFNFVQAKHFYSGKVSGCDYLSYFEKHSDSHKYLYYNDDPKNTSKQITLEVNNKYNYLLETVDTLIKNPGYWFSATTWDLLIISANEFYRVLGPKGYEYYNGKKVSRVTLPNSPFCRRIMQSPFDHEIWIETSDGIANISGNKYKYYAISDESRITSMSFDPLNKNWIWVGLANGSFGYFDILNKKYVVIDGGLIGNTKKSNHPISNILFDLKNNVWIFSKGNGVYIFSRNDVNKKNLKPTLWSTLNYSDDTYRFDNRGNLWGIVSDGILVYKAGISQVPENPSYYRLIDPTNEIGYIANFRNFYRFPKALVKDTMTVYNEDGSVLFFALDKLFPEVSLKNPISISTIYINHEAKDLDSSKYKQYSALSGSITQFKYFENNVGFDFGTLNAVKYNLVYRYKLNGLDTNWHEVKENSVYFNNLAPGKYSLNLEYSFDKFKWSDSTVYSFVIAPPWWATLWFRTFAVLIIMAAVLLYIRHRTLSINERNIQLQKQVSERTEDLKKTIADLKNSNNKNEMLISVLAHDVKSPMRFLSDVSTNLYNSWDNIEDERKRALGLEIKKSTKSIYIFLSEFLTWIKLNIEKGVSRNIETVDILSLLKRVKKYHEETGNISNNIIEIDLANDVRVKTNKNYLEIIIRNLVDNACKYTAYGKIYLSAYPVNSGIVISCRDTGKGMSSDLINLLMFEDSGEENKTQDELDSYKLGYRFIKDMIKEIDAQIEIVSEVKVGTEVKIILNNSNLSV